MGLSFADIIYHLRTITAWAGQWCLQAVMGGFASSIFHSCQYQKATTSMASRDGGAGCGAYVEDLFSLAALDHGVPTSSALPCPLAGCHLGKIFAV